MLRRVYGVDSERASGKALSLLEAPINFVAAEQKDITSALNRCVLQDLDANDSLLLQACLNLDIPSLASDDRRLLKACEAEGVNSQSPVAEEHRESMRRWEAEKLLPSGLPRLLGRVYT